MDLCTVISQDYIPQAVNLIQSYKVNSFDGDVFVYYFNTEKEQLEIFNKIFGSQVKLYPVKEVCEHALSPRVFFYKTYALADCFLNHSDSLIYSDSANCFVNKTDSIENDLVDESLFLVYTHPKLTNQYWCTKKSLQVMGSFGAEIMPQYWAGFQAYKKTNDNIKFINDMYDYMLNPQVALPDTTVIKPDGPDSLCREHRQDQSVFSVMIHKHNRHQMFNVQKNTKYGDWQTIVEFDHGYKHDFDRMVLSPRESKFNNFRYLSV